jgi:PhnB protein
MHVVQDPRKSEPRIEGFLLSTYSKTSTLPVQGSKHSLFIYVADCDATYQRALDNGAISIMPPANQDYGRSCGVRMPFGTLGG